MLDDDPAATLDALMDAVRAGATAEQMGGAVAYAAFLRMARFHTSNEFGDWDTVHNTLTAANALHQALVRAPFRRAAALRLRYRHQRLSRPLPQYARPENPPAQRRARKR